MFARYTLGAEEELQVVDASTLALAGHDFAASARAFPDDVGALDVEIHKCALEIKTGICERPQQLAREIADLRHRARRWAASQDQRVFAAGLHPFSDWRHQGTHDKPHYQHLINEFQDVARGNLVFGLHVHVGLPEPARRIAVMNLLRDDLPLLLALSASSPFFEGADTGLQSWRHRVFCRYPRTGIPAIWADEAAYWAHQQRLVNTACLEAGHQLWDDLRLHRKYGTLEVRICDANASLWRTELIAALTQASAAAWDVLVADGMAPVPTATALIDENKWRVGRHGLTGKVVDWRRDEELSMARAFERWLDRIERPARAFGTFRLIEDGLARALFQGTSADRQKRVAGASTDLRAVVSALIAETAAPHTRAEPVVQAPVVLREQAA